MRTFRLSNHCEEVNYRNKAGTPAMNIQKAREAIALVPFVLLVNQVLRYFDLTAEVHVLDGV
jgi:hypothetical protein